MPTDRLLGALGLCVRAGKLIRGTPLICEALKSERKPGLVLLASDASENTAKRLRDRCACYGVTLIPLATDADTLSDAVGKSGRITAVAVTDENLCRLVSGAVKDYQKEHNL